MGYKDKLKLRETIAFGPTNLPSSLEEAKEHRRILVDRLNVINHQLGKKENKKLPDWQHWRKELIEEYRLRQRETVFLKEWINSKEQEEAQKNPETRADELLRAAVGELKRLLDLLDIHGDCPLVGQIERYLLTPRPKSSE